MSTSLTSFELKIIKWIFLPFFACWFALIFWNATIGRNKCENTCKEKAFYDFRYAPGRTAGTDGDKRYCLTEEESNVEKRISKGTRVY